MKSWDLDECAEFLKISRSTALKLADDGILPGAMIGRAWVFIDEDIVEYLRKAVSEQQRKRQEEAAIDSELGVTTSRRNRHRKVRPELPSVV